MRSIRSLILTCLFLLASVSFGQAPSEPIEANPLPDLPRLPEQPRSLFAPAVRSGPLGSPSPGPYFEEDPRLDPPELPPPGWFADVEAEFVADCRKRLNVCPLGAAAMAGTSLPIDRAHVAEALVFEGVAANSMDVSSARD